MEDFDDNDNQKTIPLMEDGCVPTLNTPVDTGTEKIPGIIYDVDYTNELPPELPTRYTPKMKPESPEHTDSKHKGKPQDDQAYKDLLHSDSNHKREQTEMENKPAHAHAKKRSNPLAVRSPLALSVDFSDEKIPALPARRRLSQPTIMPFGKQASEAYVNTSVCQVTVRPFKWKSSDRAENDVNINANTYESVGTEKCVLSVAHDDLKSVAPGKTNESKIISNDDGHMNKDEKIKSANIERINDLTINEIGDMLRLLKLKECVDIFKENYVDGAILTSLERDDLVNELGMKKIPATILFMYITTSHIPK
ncbi:uncharacterized protein LOC127858214 isoform X1 [Dreissena polymorpha]|uniref:SAM domain-containing protein n=1 Tax=Dreissena polymorpha TaxID=45954 RepID=A0A9D3Z7E5_DREPO|nr:uncharacterized protein LOC127858214 isoform X1 [Dreissena polymorpha]KAH3711599.1 hypothetical protein DPMN_071270 [Dreissena polymorpha]